MYYRSINKTCNYEKFKSKMKRFDHNKSKKVFSEMKT